MDLIIFWNKFRCIFRCSDCQICQVCGKVTSFSSSVSSASEPDSLSSSCFRAKDVKLQGAAPLGLRSQGRTGTKGPFKPPTFDAVKSQSFLYVYEYWVQKISSMSGKIDNWPNGSNKFQIPIPVSFRCLFHIVLLDQLPSSGQSLTASTGSSGMSWGISGEFGKVRWLRTRTIHSLLRVHFGHSAGSSGINLENSREGELWWGIHHDTMGTHCVPSKFCCLVLKGEMNGLGAPQF